MHRVCTQTVSRNRYQNAILNWKLTVAKFESFIHFQQMLVWR